MSLVALDGTPLMRFGLGQNPNMTSPTVTNATLDATNEAVIAIGQVFIVGGAAKTLDTSGASSIGWRTGAVTNASASTVMSIGIAAVDTSNGPPGRAVNVADVVTFDVSAVLTGSGVVTANAWQTTVPTTGTKSIANGDFVAFVVQMTTRGGVDSVVVSHAQSSVTIHRPTVTTFLGGSYAASTATPTAIITFSDGTLGYFWASDVASTYSDRTWNSGSATKEYGQLYQPPFPTKAYGLYGWLTPSADCDIVLYSDPLGGSPVPEKTISIDANTVAAATSRTFWLMFDAPYTMTAGQIVGAVFKPGGSNVTARYKTLASATHRIVDNGGVNSYGISRASGAFADANSGLDHYYIGLILGAYDNGVGGAGGLFPSKPMAGNFQG